VKDGWVCLHRAIKKNPHYQDPGWLQVWIELLLGASHTEYETIFAGKRIILKPGQLITGRRTLAADIKRTTSKVERVLKVMEIEHQIEQQTSNKSRLITILNWNRYQQTEHQNGQQTDNKRTTNPPKVVENRTLYNKNNNQQERERGVATRLSGF